MIDNIIFGTLQSMKIALVNLCKIQDFSKTKYFQDSFEFLKENGIDFIDYISGRETETDLLNGFHEAVNNSEVELVWFIQGGNDMVKFLDKIDWELIKITNKEYFGLSDFTHFAFKAVALNRVCHYGPGLKQIKSYLPTIEERQFVVDFLKNKQTPPYFTQLLSGNGDINLENEKIIGGHSFVSAIMLPITNIDLGNRFLFFEHHYIPGEGLADAAYFLDAVKLYTSHNKPLGIVLGHSLLFDENNNPLDIELINKYLMERLVGMDLPVYYVDHFKTIIKLS